MWFITLIVLALAAFLVIKAVKAQSDRKSSSDASSAISSGLQGQLSREQVSKGAPKQQSAANDETQAGISTPSVPPDDAQASIDTGESSAPANTQQDQLTEIREMIKILNLAEADSVRLGISSEQFNALIANDSSSIDAAAMPSSDTLTDVADRLRRMLA